MPGKASLIKRSLLPSEKPGDPLRIRPVRRLCGWESLEAARWMVWRCSEWLAAVWLTAMVGYCFLVPS